MKKTIGLLIFSGIVLLTFPAKAQIVISFGANYGSYKMEELTNFQNELKNSFTVQAKSISTFPNFIGYEGKLYYTLSRFQFGLFGSFNSSGSRLSYSDYSGSLEFNQSVNIKQLGLGCEYNLSSNQEQSWQPFVLMQIGYGKTHLVIEDKATVGSTILVDEELIFSSRNFTINPGFGIRRKIAKWLFVSASAGYLFDTGGELEYSEDDSYYLVGANGEPIHSDWSGFRLGATLSFKI